MICVSIARGRHRHVIAEHRHLVEQGAKLVELRLDYIRGDVNVKRLVAERPCPVVITCRRDRDGGKFAGTEEQRRLLLRTAIAEGVEYVDLEEDIAAEIPRFGPTKRIVSLHDFRKTPDDLEAIHRRLCQLDPDVVKISTMANHPQDNLRMLRLVASSPVPMVGLCMGDIGTPTRILAGRFGPLFTFATFHHERALAPGQLSFEQMRDIYHYDEINRDTEVYAVIADPVGHSLSPLIHNAAFRHLKLNKVYVPIRVPREDLAQFLDDAPQMGIKGLSVTIPHKEAVIERLTQVDGAVRGIGAANTIVFEGGQRLGFNTDYRAAMDALETAMGGAEGSESPAKGKTALILGAGGAGRAIAYGLVRRGANVVLSDGDGERAKLLAQRLNCRSTEWAARHVISAEILVNCTPVGMHPNVDDSPYDRHHLRPAMVVFDVVYNPETTLLIKEARARNCKVVTGVEMFVRQACLQFQLFTGHEGPAELMRESLKRATSAAKNEDFRARMNLILIGYRATGKTTLARLLAERLGWDWVDADVEIERRAGKPIARIFAEDGEPAFRDLEARVIADLCRRQRLVLAAGGGAPMRPESRQAMRTSGKVVWLKARPETVHARMSGDATTAARRPNLTAAGGLEEIVQLLGRREPIYREAAHLEVDTEGKEPLEVAAEILARLQSSLTPATPT